MIIQRSTNLFRAVGLMINKTAARTVYKPVFSFNNKYLGRFDYHDQEKYPRKLSPYKEEELLDEIHATRNLQIDNPSPFHVVRRIRSMTQIPWNQKVTLRRLNLHSSFNGECVLVPNTPQFNDMLSKVKHLIELRPAIFVDGKIPTEEDIGAIKICPYTGQIKVDEKLRLLANRVNVEKPPLFRGNNLRHQIGQLYVTS